MKYWISHINKTSLLIMILITVFSQYLQGQTSTLNYIQTKTFTVSGITSQMATSTTNRSQVQTTVEYFDGLGRSIQTIQKQASPLGYDIITPIVYDQYGRETMMYLPYVSVSTVYGSYQASAIADQATFYNPPGSSGRQQSNGIVRTSTPFALINYESSPLNRIVEQGAPGDSWQITLPGNANSNNHTKRTSYTTNDVTTFFNSTPITNNPGSKVVAVYSTFIDAITGSQRLIRSAAAYSAGQLFITITKDENWQYGNGCIGTEEEYKDQEGHIILKRSYNLKNGAIEILSTYFVYDDLGNLAFILPPGASPDNSGTPIQTTLDNLCYQYNYDKKHRLIAKKLPGKGWEYLVYNSIDQVVATQDSVQRMKPTNQQAFYTKYDVMGRVAMTGYYKLAGGPSSNLRSSMQSDANSTAGLWENRTASGTGYTNTAYPTTSLTILSTNYYDNYTNIPSFPANFIPPSSGASSMTTGLLTASKVAVLNTPANMLWTVSYFDDFGRPTKTYNQHYLGGTSNTANYDATLISYYFSNQINVVQRQHYTLASTTPKVIIGNSYEYDYMGRKFRTGEQIYIGSTPGLQVYLSLIEYNELGQLRYKHYHSIDGSTYLGEGSYNYNERGWLSAITPMNNSYYGEIINYDVVNTTTPAAIAQFNGNISQFIYNSPKENQVLTPPRPSTDKKTVNYFYDNLNRLTSSQTDYSPLDESVTYDQMGNIKTLTRNSGAHTENFSYAYMNGGLSNQLSTVTQSGRSVRNFFYDGNGNTTSDSTSTRKAVAYNMLNLPLTVKSGSTLLTTYTYDAAGHKLRNVSRPIGTGDGTRDYINGIVYSDNHLGGVTDIDLIQTDEGKAYVPPGGTAFYYTYDLKDYLGNVRSSFDNSGPGGSAGEIQENDYYPFGLNQQYGGSSYQNRYLYNGKEQQMDLTSQYDYGARFYDPIIARFNTIDRYAEKYSNMTPYQYGALNPIKNIDANGDSIRVTATISIDVPFVGTVKATANLYFEGSTAYYQNGTEYKGNDAFVGQVSSALADLNNGIEGKALVDFVEASTTNTQIVDDTKTQGNQTASDGSAIRWGANNLLGGVDQNGSTSRPAFVGLAHELAHVEDIDKKTIDTHPWFDILDANGNKTGSVPNADKFATYIENQVRAEHGLPLREFYSPDASGAGYEPSRILSPGTNNNLFYRPPQLPNAPLPHVYITPSTPSSTFRP